MNQRPRQIAFIILLSLAMMLPAVTRAQALTNAFSFDEFLLVPVRVHLLAAKDSPSIQTTLTETDIARIWKKVNGVWAQAGMHFYIESLVREEVVESHPLPRNQIDREALLGLRTEGSRAGNMIHVHYVKEMSVNGIYFVEAIFVKDTASLRRVEGGIDEPLPRVTSHELGHAFTLPHRQDSTNLMASGTTGIWLNEAEIAQARQAAKSLKWVVPAPDVMKAADEELRAKNLEEAARLYSRLATLPLNAEEVDLAKERSGKTSD